MSLQFGSSSSSHSSVNWGSPSTTSSSLRLGQVGQHVQLVEGQVQLVQPVSRPERRRWEVPDPVVREVKSREVGQLCDVL